MSRIEDNCQFNEDFIKNYNEESDEGYSFEVYVQYLQKLLELHNDLPFLPERMKIKKSQKIAANLHDKTEYVIRIRNLKQVLNHELVLKKVHKVIEFNQNAWLKPYIDMTIDLKKKNEKWFGKRFFLSYEYTLFIYSFGIWSFWKKYRNVREHGDIALVTAEIRRNYLVSEPHYHATKFYTENVLATEMKK